MIQEHCLFVVPYCEDGDYFNFVDGKCQKCGVGMYQVKDQRDVCHNCADGTTTRGEGLMSEEVDGSDVCYGKLWQIEASVVDIVMFMSDSDRPIILISRCYSVEYSSSAPMHIR